jgi:protease II
MDEKHRAHRVYRHVLHQHHDHDELLLEEHDPSVFMDVSRTKDQVRPISAEGLRV